MFDSAVGTKTGIYASTDLQQMQPVGSLCYDTVYQAFFRFLKNTGAALAASLCATAPTTSKSSYYCELAAATDALMNFAGVRVVGATSVTQNYYAWLQVSGQASFLHSGGEATVAEKGIVTSASVAGKVEGVADSADGAKGVIAIAEAAKTTLDEVTKGSIVRCVFAP